MQRHQKINEAQPDFNIACLLFCLLLKRCVLKSAFNQCHFKI